jgi:hypothetical protein
MNDKELRHSTALKLVILRFFSRVIFVAGHVPFLIESVKLNFKICANVIDERAHHHNDN